MGYQHINNLYKDTRILAFKECFALEKVHGTSAHLLYTGKGTINYSSGGASSALFKSLFNMDAMIERFKALGHESIPITVYGEAYGGKEQGMSATYGKSLCFIVFEVKIGESWLDVPNAADVTEKLGLEFVPWVSGPTDMAFLDGQRDADSLVAVRRGMGPGKKREGIVIRPPFEVRLNTGERMAAKHKRDEFRETATPRVVDPANMTIIEQEAAQFFVDATAIANEWVTEMRLTHVLQTIPEPHGMEQTPLVIRGMIEDVTREAAGEIVNSKAAQKAIGSRAAKLYKARVAAIKL